MSEIKIVPAIKLGNTARQVAFMIGNPDEVLVDQWDRDTGPLYEWIQWTYNVDESLRNINLEEPLRDTYLYFDIDRKLTGWDISKYKKIRTVYDSTVEVTDDYILKIGDSRDTVAASKGTPQRLIPQGWGNQVEAPEVWEYQDDFNNVISTIYLIDGIVTDIK